MIKSIVEKKQLKRKQRARQLQFEREILEIEGEDPLCILKKSSKNT
jgi:hypothetical protein